MAEDRTKKRTGAPSYGVLNLEHLPPGHVIDDRYEIKEKLGQGGFGAVYRAFDRNMDIDKALKVIPEAVANDEEAMADLQAEARTMVALEHAHITRVYDFHYLGKIKYIDMAYIDGETLTRLKLRHSDKRVPEKVVRMLAIQIAEGLAYAHSRGVIHKDIKPSNIMVTSEGQVKIMDFGIAEKLRISMSRAAQTSSSGTLVYMSPEQIRGKDVGKETDIYSFGAVLYELLSGHPPFYQGDIQYQILNEKPVKLENVSSELQALIMWCLEKKFKKRCGIAEVQKALGQKAPVYQQAPKSKPSIAKVIPTTRGKISKLTNISIVTRPAGATVWIDGKKQNKVTPLTVEWQIGTVQVRMEKRGYAPIEEQVQFTEQEVNRFRIELESITGSITVKSDIEGKKIWLNGENTGFQTPHTFEDLLPWEHTLELRGETYFSEPKVLKLGQKEQQSVVLQAIEFSYLHVNTEYKDLVFEVKGVETMRPGRKVKIKPGKYSLHPSFRFLPTIEATLKPGLTKEVDYDDLIQKQILTIETRGRIAVLSLSCNEIEHFYESHGILTGEQNLQLSLLPGNYEISLHSKAGFHLRDYDVDLTSENATIDVGKELELRQKRIRRRVAIVLGIALSILIYSVFHLTTDPRAPDLRSPTNGSTVRTNTLTFRWVDVPRGYRYQLVVDDNRDFSSHVENQTFRSGGGYATALGNGTYYWKVRARNRAGDWGDWSSIWSFTVNYNPVPVAPSLLKPSNNSSMNDNTPTYDWSDVPHPYRYQLVVDNNRDFSSHEVRQSSLSRSTCSSSSALSNGTYYWKVRARNRAGDWGNWSSVRRFTVNYNPVPVAPSLLKPSNNSSMNDNTPTFDWSDVAHAYRYQLVVDNNRDFSSHAIRQTNLNRSTYTRSSSSALGNGTYYWKVRARNRAGDWGNWSSVWSVRILRSSPSDDNYEQNDTRSNAYDLSNLEKKWLSSIRGYGIQRDDDWYKISVSSTYTRVTIQCRFIHRRGDIDIALHDRSGKKLSSATSTTDNEQITHRVSSSGTYYIRVYFKGAGNQYDLWWDDTK